MSTDSAWEALYSQNVTFIEQQFALYQQDPNQVDPSLQAYFESWPDRVPLAAPTVLSTSASPDEVTSFLKQIPIFSQVEIEDLDKLAAISQKVSYPEGSLIAQSGQTGNDLYIILDGTVWVQRDGQTIADLNRGEVIGELAVLDDKPRSADMVACDDVVVLQINKQSFNDVLDANPGLARGLLRKLASRLRLAGTRQEKVDQLIRAYRHRGHVQADLDPLGRHKADHPELGLEFYGLAEEDLGRKFAFRKGNVNTVLTLKEILKHLRKTYCGAIGVQFMHIDDLEIQSWLQERMEETANQREMTREEKIHILTKLTDAEQFENFLHRKFVGAKRFSLEGGESLIPLLDHAIEQAGNHGIDEIIIGMAHRGRLNVLANIMGKPARQIFREFKDLDAGKQLGKGDVKYHLGYSTDRKTAAGRNVHLSLCFNPSHLGFVGPVATGRTRAKQDRFGDKAHARAMPLIIHGDAAFVGQGVTQELFNMSALPGYTIGGTVHVILNNQIGFTTNPEEARSSQYSTDVARMLQIPIFHVNGEHPEAVAQVIQLAMDFRQKFQQDVVIDMYCYRKYGHNEGDDPSFTQPLMYSQIKRMPTVRKNYVSNLSKLGGISDADVKAIAEESHKRLEADLEDSSKEVEEDHQSSGLGLWKKYTGGKDSLVPEVDTAISMENCQHYLKKLAEIPTGFNVHNKVKRFLEAYEAMAKGEQGFHWGAGEALAFASLVDEGYPVRLSGQDCGRGTFSHRHAVWNDAKTGTRHIPLQHIRPDQGKFVVLNSPLSEVGVLGFEYGYSLDLPDGLVIWEAQFGDFCNVAQVIIDQFITSSEDKWNRLSGLTLLLPHGFEGQGPEHSSARLERFLSLAAEDNIQVMNLTTPAQIFHALRRQVLRPLRKPLVIMSPKSLLRHPKAVSKLEAFTEGRFQKVIPDRVVEPDKVNKIILCSGKVYYELLEKRDELKRDDVAIMRLEQYYPIPMDELKVVLEPYAKKVPVLWVQEEPANMGAWYFLSVHIGQKLYGHSFLGLARAESASPATGSHGSHHLEQESILTDAFE